MCAVENELFRPLQVSCSAMSANRSLKDAILSGQSVIFFVKMRVG